MTTQVLYLQFNDMLRSMDLPELYFQYFLKAVKSNALKIEEEQESNYRLPQIILHATFCELAERLRPKNPDSLIESENLQRFL